MLLHKLIAKALKIEDTGSGPTLPEAPRQDSQGSPVSERGSDSNEHEKQAALQQKITEFEKEIQKLTQRTEDDDFGGKRAFRRKRDALDGQHVYFPDSGKAGKIRPQQVTMRLGDIPAHVAEKEASPADRRHLGSLIHTHLQTYYYPPQPFDRIAYDDEPASRPVVMQLAKKRDILSHEASLQIFLNSPYTDQEDKSKIHALLGERKIKMAVQRLRFGFSGMQSYWQQHNAALKDKITGESEGEAEYESEERTRSELKSTMKQASNTYKQGLEQLRQARTHWESVQYETEKYILSIKYNEELEKAGDLTYKDLAKIRRYMVHYFLSDGTHHNPFTPDFFQLLFTPLFPDFQTKLSAERLISAVKSGKVDVNKIEKGQLVIIDEFFNLFHDWLKAAPIRTILFDNYISNSDSGKKDIYGCLIHAQLKK
ncbi:hypothetical protein ACFL96_00715 [Thermoproteota archaeon]